MTSTNGVPNPGMSSGVSSNGSWQPPVAAGAMTPGRPAGVATVAVSTGKPAGYSGYVSTPLPTQPPPVAPRPQCPPKPPEKLTTGIPTPAEIDRQKDGYAKGIDKQFHNDADALSKTHQHYTDFLYSQAEQTKAQMILAIDQQVKQQELVMSQKYNEQLMVLHQAAQKQRTELEQQANSLALEYHTRKTQEDFMFKQYALEKDRYDSQMKLHTELQKMRAPRGQLPMNPAVMPPMPPSMPNAQVSSAAMLPPTPWGTGTFSPMPAPPSKGAVPQMPGPVATGTYSPMPGGAPGIQAMTVQLPGGLASNGVHAGMPAHAAMAQLERTIPEQLDRVFEKFSGQISATQTPARTATTAYSADPSGLSGAGSSFSHSRAGSYSVGPGSLSASLAGSYHAPAGSYHAPAGSYHAPAGSYYGQGSSYQAPAGSYNPPPAAAGAYSAVYGASCNGSYGVPSGAMVTPPGATNAMTAPVASWTSPGDLAASALALQRAKNPCPSCGTVFSSARRRPEETSCPSYGDVMANARRRPEEVNQYARPAPASVTSVSQVCPPSPRPAVGVEAFTPAFPVTTMPSAATTTMPPSEGVGHSRQSSVASQVKNHLDASVAV